MTRLEQGGRVTENDGVLKEDLAVDFVAVRKGISKLVGEKANGMVGTLIDDGNSARLAAMKYLFEIVGLYPATEATTGEAFPENSLAGTLLMRLGLPLEPVVAECGKNNEPGRLRDDRLTPFSAENAEKIRGGRGEEQTGACGGDTVK